jgi:hypothetical protein
VHEPVVKAILDEDGGLAWQRVRGHLDALVNRVR